MDEIQIVILAAGLGKRMGNKELPKALVKLRGKTLIKYLLESIEKSGVCKKPMIVVGKSADLVKAELGGNYTYILQEQQLGTGHAVACTRKELEGKAEDIMVLYGDHPFVTARMIEDLAQKHIEKGDVLTMAVVKVPDFEGWRHGFYDFGRIIRNNQGKICQIIEKKDANESQKEIREVNPAYFCFKADWLWRNLANLKNNNAASEYYLTDLLSMACAQGQEIATVEINPQEALGINTPEQLALIDKLLD